MRFRLGAMIGFGAGYYLGTRAGRERYEELQAWVERLRDTEAYRTATEKARAVADLATERARDAMGSTTGDATTEGGPDDTRVIVLDDTTTTATTATTTAGGGDHRP